MNELAASYVRNVQAMLNLIEKQSPEMGEAYKDAFRYLMYRDLYKEIEMNVRKIQQQIPHESRVAAFAT